MTPLEELRAPFVGTAQLHFNNAGVAPMTQRAHDAGARVLERMREGSLAVPGHLRDYEDARGVFAKLVGAAHVDVAFFQTCASAISQVALGISFQSDEEIVLVDQEYPSNAYPWHRAAERADARVVTVSSEPGLGIDVDRVLGAITPRTRVVTVSWVQYSTGTTVPLRALADAVHQKGAADAWLVVDAIQGLGVLPFDLASSGADAVCGGTHKWLLGPLGHGFFALAPGRGASLAPVMHGAMTYGTPDDTVDAKRPARVDDPRRFEPGAPLLLGAIPGAASIELLLAIGIDRVRDEALAVADLIAERARERGLRVIAGTGPVRSPITTVVPARIDAKGMVDGLRARGCSTAPRGGGVRMAPHAHNGPHHVDALFGHWDALDR